MLVLLMTWSPEIVTNEELQMLEEPSLEFSEEPQYVAKWPGTHYDMIGSPGASNCTRISRSPGTNRAPSVCPGQAGFCSFVVFEYSCM